MVAQATGGPKRVIDSMSGGRKSCPNGYLVRFSCKATGDEAVASTAVEA